VQCGSTDEIVASLRADPVFTGPGTHLIVAVQAELDPGPGTARNTGQGDRTDTGMAAMTRTLTLGALIHGSGGHIAGWRHPEAYAAGQLDFDFHAELARVLERGRFDALFIADVVAIWGHQLDSLSRTGRAEHFEPLTHSALSTVTEHIGLIATATTTYNEPYHVARKFASLDHLSHGRAGWNIVTSVVPLEAANFGRADHLEHRCGTSAPASSSTCRQLWDSFSDKAILRDTVNARYCDSEQLRAPHHRGSPFTVRGPLNISRPPQGHPVLFQAGSSETGKDFAARHGEVLFTAQPDLPAAQAFYRDIKDRVAAAGRDPAHVLAWPVLSPLVADTEAGARGPARRATARRRRPPPRAGQHR
jgi:FMN-dependent oxidoreductase (nitrilotriacetate monooxygenase family)